MGAVGPGAGAGAGGAGGGGGGGGGGGVGAGAGGGGVGVGAGAGGVGAGAGAVGSGAGAVGSGVAPSEPPPPHAVNTNENAIVKRTIAGAFWVCMLVSGGALGGSRLRASHTTRTGTGSIPAEPLSVLEQ